MMTGEKPNKKMTLRIYIRIAALLLAVILLCAAFASCGTGFFEYKEWDGSTWELGYQFQDLNRGLRANSNETADMLPVELCEAVLEQLRKEYAKENAYRFGSFEQFAEHRYSGTATLRHRFVLEDEIYAVYNARYFNCTYVYREKDSSLVIVLQQNKSGLLGAVQGLFLSGNCLFYRIPNSYRKADVLTGEIKKLSRKEYEAEYFKIVPPQIDLKSGKNHTTDFLRQDKNISEITASLESRYGWLSFFLYGGIYSNGTYLGGGEHYFIADGILCRYNSGADTYVRITRLGKWPRACFLEGEYLYYTYGKEGVRFTDMLAVDPPTKKFVAYARISILRLVIEIVDEADFLELYNAAN